VIGTSYHSNQHNDLAELSAAVVAYAEERIRLAPPLDRPLTEAELHRDASGQTITPEGRSRRQSRRCGSSPTISPRPCLSVDHPRYLSFIPCAPSDAASMFDLVVGASSIYAGSWLEGSGAVYAENLACAGSPTSSACPEGRRGLHLPGGTIGNLSALVAARHTARAAGDAGSGRRAHPCPWRHCDRGRAQFDQVGLPR
jgi:L-2,4-diaminobutyrate decarboxylase